jgi:hypothetical protein
MTYKRFTLRKPDIDNDIDCEEIADNGEWITYGDVVDLLNEQDQRIKELTNFKNKVFSILDEEIQYKKGLKELSEEQEMSMSLERFGFEYAMLLTIKRKLEEIE